MRTFRPSRSTSTSSVARATPATVEAGHCSGIMPTMAFLVRRPGGRFEIRESRATPSGPRARTLATFRVLTGDVLTQARARAHAPFDTAKIKARAAELRVPRRSSVAAATAERLIAQLRAGELLPAAVAAELRSLLPSDSDALPDTLSDAREWLGVDDATRGRAVVDLLLLADAIPHRRPPDEIA